MIPFLKYRSVIWREKLRNLNGRCIKFIFHEIIFVGENEILNGHSGANIIIFSDLIAMCFVGKLKCI